MQNLWGVINSLQLLTYMAFMHVNLTPHLYIVFDMLLVSHFDFIPLQEVIVAALKKLVYDGKLEPFTPHTPNMGLFEFESGLMFVNLTDSWLTLVFLGGIYVILWIGVKVTLNCKGSKVFSWIYNYCQGRMDQYKYNAILRILLEIYLDIALFSFIGCYQFSFGDGARGTSTTFSMILFVRFTF